VCKLHKSLYGLKQSPRAWNQKLDTFLKSVEFMKSEVDPNVYVTQVGDVKSFIVVYVDDLILVCNDRKINLTTINIYEFIKMSNVCCK